MIGNIMVAGNATELQFLINYKGTYLQAYAEACKNSGVNQEIHHTKIVVVNDIEGSGDDYIVASILLPNSRAMFFLIDEDYNNFVYEYYNKLDNDPDIQEYIAVLLAGMLERNFDYILYFDNDDAKMWMPICKALVDYLYSRFGVLCYGIGDIRSNPQLLLSQGIIPECVVKVQDIVNRYKLSNRPNDQLFIQY
jgi:hypothetical protein